MIQLLRSTGPARHENWFASFFLSPSSTPIYLTLASQSYHPFTCPLEECTVIWVKTLSFQAFYFSRLSFCPLVMHIHTQVITMAGSCVAQQLNNVASRELTETSAEPKLRLPSWFDRARFDRARAVINDHFLAIFFCHLSGLVLLVFIKSIYTTLSLTGKSKNYTASFYRYMRTIFKVKSWYDGKVYEAGDDAAIALLEVKRMHQHVSQVQNRDRKLGEELAISQRDMVLTQFAFIGLIVLHPAKFGIHHEPDKSVEKVIYFWRVIGSLLGIKDEHNLAMGSIEKVRERCQIIFDECFRPALVNELNPDMFAMCKHILIGSNEWVYSTRFRSTMRYLFESIDVDQRRLWDDFNFMELFCYIALKYVMNYALQFRPIRYILNQLFHLAVWRLGQKSFVETIVATLKQFDISAM